MPTHTKASQWSLKHNTTFCQKYTVHACKKLQKPKELHFSPDFNLHSSSLMPQTKVVEKMGRNLSAAPVSLAFFFLLKLLSI